MISTFESPPIVSVGQPFQPMPQFYGFTFYSDPRGVTTPQYTAFQTALPSLTLRAAIDEVMVSKSNAGLHPHSIQVMRSVLNSFARGREHMPLASINAREIENWLASQKVKPVTKRSVVTRLSSLFSHHIRKDNITANPCRKLERIKVEHHAPTILTPEQTDTLLRNTPRKFRAYVILGLFAGIRPEETLKITWEDICLETKTVTVNFAKTRRRRIVPLEPRAVALLKQVARKKGDIAPSNTTVGRFKREVCESLGFDSWPQDLLRHTAASYLLALLGDVGKVAARLGNSSAVLLTHYHQPVKQAACGKFWNVTSCPIPKPISKIVRKHDYKAVIAFYDSCKSYKKTLEQFGISNSATLHYILHTRKPKVSTKA